MLLHQALKNFGHFGPRKAIVKSSIFKVKLPIERFLPIFACIYKDFEVDNNHVFDDLKKIEIKI